MKATTRHWTDWPTLSDAGSDDAGVELNRLLSGSTGGED
jgi:hypothetical protein